MTNPIRFRAVDATDRRSPDIAAYYVTFHGAGMGTVGHRMGMTLRPGKPVIFWWVARTAQGLESPRFSKRIEATNWLIANVVTGARP